MTQVNTDRLVEDLKAVVRDAEELLKAMAGLAGEHIAQVGSRAEASLRSAREKLAELVDCDGVAGRVRDAAGRADHVHSSPWLALGAGAALGLVVGLLVGRRNQDSSR